MNPDFWGPEQRAKYFGLRVCLPEGHTNTELGQSTYCTFSLRPGGEGGDKINCEISTVLLYRQAIPPLPFPGLFLKESDLLGSKTLISHLPWGLKLHVKSQFSWSLIPWGIRLSGVLNCGESDCPDSDTVVWIWAWDIRYFPAFKVWLAWRILLLSGLISVANTVAQGFY